MSRASKTKRMEKTWDSGCILYIYWHNRTHYLREKREQTNLKIEQKREWTGDGAHDNNFAAAYATTVAQPWWWVIDGERLRRQVGDRATAMTNWVRWRVSRVALCLFWVILNFWWIHISDRTKSMGQNQTAINVFRWNIYLSINSIDNVIIFDIILSIEKFRW